MITETLQHLIEDVATWPAEDQQELAEYARAIHAGRTGQYVVTDAERVVLVDSARKADQGEFMADAEVTAADRRHGA